MFIDDLPRPALYNLCKYLSLHDIRNLSTTCKQLFHLIEHDDYFWMKLIENQFHIYQRYVHQLFQKKTNSDYDLYDTEEDRQKSLRKFRKLLKLDPCIGWLWNLLNCTNDSPDGYLAYKRRKHQESSPRTNR